MLTPENDYYCDWLEFALKIYNNTCSTSTAAVLNAHLPLQLCRQKLDVTVVQAGIIKKKHHNRCAYLSIPRLGSTVDFFSFFGACFFLLFKHAEQIVSKRVRHLSREKPSSTQIPEMHFKWNLNQLRQPERMIRLSSFSQDVLY